MNAGKKPDTSAFNDKPSQWRQLEAMGLVAGGLAHDLNNHVTIIGHTAEMAEMLNEPKRHLQAWRQVHTLCERARLTIDRIHAFSRLTSKREQLIDLAAITGDAIRLLRASQPPEIILVGKGTDVDSCQILANANQVQELLIHLIHAAVSSLPSGGGKIEISLYTAASGPGDAHAGATDCRKGCGWKISSKEMSQTPDLWRRLPTVSEPAAMPVYGGQWELAERVRGLLSVYKGKACWADKDETVLAIEWPCAATGGARRESQDGPVKTDDREMAGWHVAVVEDEPSELDLLRDVLRIHGAKVSAFGAADDFLRWLAGGAPPDLLVVDQILDEHSGEYLIERLHETSPSTSVLLIGGKVDARVPDWAAGRPVRTLPKPFTFAELFAALQDLPRRAS